MELARLLLAATAMGTPYMLSLDEPRPWIFASGIEPLIAEDAMHAARYPTIATLFDLVRAPHGDLALKQAVIAAGHRWADGPRYGTRVSSGPPGCAAFTFLQEQIEWHLRIASLLVGLAVGPLSLIGLWRKIRGRRWIRLVSRKSSSVAGLPQKARSHPIAGISAKSVNVSDRQVILPWSDVQKG